MSARKPRFVWRPGRGFYWTFNVYRPNLFFLRFVERVEIGPYETLAEARRVWRCAQRATAPVAQKPQVA